MKYPLCAVVTVFQDEITAREKAFGDLNAAGRKMVERNHYASDQVAEKVRVPLARIHKKYW